MNPIAVWELKEYYYTTTFGSRVADGIYETLLDGMELEDMRANCALAFSTLKAHPRRRPSPRILNSPY